MFLASLFVLIAILSWIQCLAYKKNVDNKKLDSSLYNLQYKYFIVYFPAVFADWLQGPYLYKLYSLYGFRDDQIFFLYIVGFASSVSFGTLVSCLADYIGRKKMCVVFNAVYAIACLTKISECFEVLLVGRVLSGIGSSILFTVFEAWYVNQHVEKEHLSASWITYTYSKMTFYNGLLAIVAGVISYIFVDILSFGPVFPFLLAVPCLMLSAVLCLLMWDETNTSQACQNSGTCILNVYKNFCNLTLVFGCIIQSVFESVMYVFIILWTPILNPIEPPLGVVFSCFMLCIMIGSSIYNLLVMKKYSSNSILTASLLLGSCAFLICVFSLSNYFSKAMYPYTCFLSFLLFEVSVGLYFPSMSFIRSLIIPENIRAGLTSWFRMPMNIITCISLLYFRRKKLEPSNVGLGTFQFYFPTLSANQQIFALCALALFCTCQLSRNLKLKINHVHYSVKNINEY